MSKTIHYIKGDATKPEGNGIKIIAHICNDIGGWGKGFVLAISKRWKEPEINYRNWYKSGDNFELGQVQFVKVEEDIIIANMIGQKGIKSSHLDVPIRYDAVDSCLKKLSDKAEEIGASIHMPRIGCGLAGGKWDMIEPLIQKNIISNGIDVWVYDFD